MRSPCIFTEINTLTQHTVEKRRCRKPKRYARKMLKLETRAGLGTQPCHSSAGRRGLALSFHFCHRCCRLSGDSKMARNLNDSPHQDRVMPLFLGTVGVRAAGALLVWASLGETRARRLPSHRSRKRRSAWDLPSTFTQVSRGNGQPRFSGIPSGAQLLTAKMRLPSEHPRRGPHLLTRPTNSRSNAAAAQSLPPYL